MVGDSFAMTRTAFRSNMRGVNEDPLIKSQFKM